MPITGRLRAMHPQYMNGDAADAGGAARGRRLRRCGHRAAGHDRHAGAAGGKRLHAPFFVDEVASHGAEGCNYLLPSTSTWTPCRGSRWRRGRPATATSSSSPTWQRCGGCRGWSGRRWWSPTWSGRTARRWRLAPPDPAPPARPAGRAGVEGQHRLGARVHAVPGQLRRGPGQALPRPRDRPTRTTSTTRSSARPWSRTCCGRSGSAWRAPGISVEDSKGECNFGQHEVNFRYSDALTMADNHSVYKNGAKEIAWLHGCALSFIAKYDEREGNSCHIHVQAVGRRRQPLPRRRRPHQRCSTTSSPASSRPPELTYFLAPNVNSYKRYARGRSPRRRSSGTSTTAPAASRGRPWAGLRLENRIAGADFNPYLAFAAIIAAGLHGIDNELALEAAYPGNAYTAEGKPRLPPACTLRSTCWTPQRSRGGVRRRCRRPLPALRADGAARFEAAVTDWELIRGFERM